MVDIEWTHILLKMSFECESLDCFFAADQLLLFFLYHTLDKKKKKKKKENKEQNKPKIKNQKQIII